jgi:hypothetical protein
MAIDDVHQLVDSHVKNPGRNQVQEHTAKCGLVGLQHQFLMTGWHSQVTCEECLK